MNTSSLLCDCHLSWLSSWLRTTSVDVISVDSLQCAHPSSLHGRSITDIDVDQFVCGMTHHLCIFAAVAVVNEQQLHLILYCKVVGSVPRDVKK